MEKNYSPLKKNYFLLTPSSNKGIKRSSDTKKLYMSSFASFSQNQIKSHFYRNSLRNKKEQKDNRNLFSKVNNSDFYKPKSDLKDRLKERRSKLNLKSVNKEYFYRIRKQINKNLKNHYKGPYMEYLIKKGYYKKKQKEDYPIYYNFYQICHMMNRKRIQLTTKYDEFKLFNDNQEYLLKFLDFNEQYIMMNYLLYYVYDIDKSTVIVNAKKIATNKQIKTMFFQLLKNNYKFDGTLEILDNIGVYFRMVFSNTGKNNIFLEKLKPVIKSEIRYLYIKDVPKYLIPNCLPNIFPVLNINVKYLLIYFKNIKYNKIEKIESYEEEKKNIKDIDLNNNYFSKRFKLNNLTKNQSDSSNLNKSSSEANKFYENINILENISLSTDKEENAANKVNNEQAKNLYNANKKLNSNDNEIFELENLIDKLEFPFVRKPNKKPTIRENKDFVFKKEIKKQKSLFKKDEININKLIDQINENDEMSLIENKNNIINNNRKLFKNLSKKEIFQTSLKGPSAIINRKKNIKFKSEINSNPIKINESKNRSNNKISREKNSRQINSNSSILSSFIKRNEKKYIKHFLRKTNSDISQSSILNLSKLKTKDVTSFKSHQKIKLRNSRELNNNNLEFNTIQGNIFYNNNIKCSENSKNIPDFFYRKIAKICQKDENIENNIIERNYKNLKIKKFPTLKEFEYIYKQIKEMGLLPKNKMLFHGNKFRAFSDFSGVNNIDNKENNEWAEKREEESIIKNNYNMDNIKRKLNLENKRNKILNRNLCTLKQIIKTTNIYY